MASSSSHTKSGYENITNLLRLCWVLLTISSFPFLSSSKSTYSEPESQDPSSPSSAISRFQQYLRINTAHPNPQYSEAADFILSQANSLSLHSQTLEFVPGKPLVLLKWPGSDPTLPSILLNSHTDVVPTEDAKWATPPLPPKSTPTAIFTPEGRRTPRSTSLDEKYNVFYGERCSWWLVIKATGAPGHGAKLYDNTAMENLMKSIESVWRFRDSQFDLVKSGLKVDSEVISVNLVFLKAGTPSPTGFVMNLQPSEAEAGFDVRVSPNADPKSLEKRIAEEWAPASRNMAFEYKQKVPVLDKFGKPVLTATDSSNPWWSLLEEAVKDANGTLGKPEIIIGTTDARYFRARGVPAIGFSPIANTPILFHDHNEFLNKDEYLKGISVYESIIKAYASYVGHGSSGISKDEL
ncbi:hypothetical protein L484_013737 [Morus notabilis]|uniref:Uncharacterized protein n=1 Tax=Morus notabilis TaxID=981085 RepID=W9QLF4_9ROSA|nr:hypothetical protein L484_013737 [Morus notabilis]